MSKINVEQFNTQKIINNKVPKSEVADMQELIRKYFAQLQARAEREVPEYGDFATVFERFKNPDNNMCASDFILQITKPPKTVLNHEKIRNLELVAYKLPSPYKASAIIATGTKDELLKKINNKDIYQEIEESLKSLSRDLEDV